MLIEKIFLISGWSSCELAGLCVKNVSVLLKEEKHLPVLVFSSFASFSTGCNTSQNSKPLFPHLSLPAVCNLGAPLELLCEVYVIKITFVEEQRAMTGNLDFA